MRTETTSLQSLSSWDVRYTNPANCQTQLKILIFNTFCSIFLFHTITTFQEFDRTYNIILWLYIVVPIAIENVKRPMDVVDFNIVSVVGLEFRMKKKNIVIIRLHARQSTELKCFWLFLIIIKCTFYGTFFWSIDSVAALNLI